jgi:hypothetical protein
MDFTESNIPPPIYPQIQQKNTSDPHIDYANDTFFEEIERFGESFTNNEKLKKLNGNRGSKHFLYINRTFFGLYNLLHDLKAEIVTKNLEA